MVVAWFVARMLWSCSLVWCRVEMLWLGWFRQGRGACCSGVGGFCFLLDVNAVVEAVWFGARWRYGRMVVGLAQGEDMLWGGGWLGLMQGSDALLGMELWLKGQ